MGKKKTNVMEIKPIIHSSCGGSGSGEIGGGEEVRKVLVGSGVC